MVLIQSGSIEDDFDDDFDALDTSDVMGSVITVILIICIFLAVSVIAYKRLQNV